MIVEDHEIKTLTRYDGMDQEEWDELIKKGALEAEEIKNAKITEYRQ